MIKKDDPLPGKAILDKAKAKEEKRNKEKKENKMKKLNINWTVVVSVLVTLVILAALAGSFVFGLKYQENYYNSVKSEAKSLLVVKAEESKK